MKNAKKLFDNFQEAAKALLGRDHPKILELLQNYDKGNLGPYFVPLNFISDIPEVIQPDEYEAKFSCRRQGNLSIQLSFDLDCGLHC